MTATNGHTLRSPYPWFGGKSRCAPLVWQRFGDAPNFVEPFFGSGAMLLARPHWPWQGNRIETVNDLDGFVPNFWRALQAEPDAVARWCDWPVSELDLHARHSWLVTQTGEFRERIRSDPDYYDAKIAGWWAWGLCQWIGSGWCEHAEWQQLPHLGDAGRGTHRPGTELYSYFTALSDRLRGVRVCCGDWSRVCGETPTVTQGLTAVFLDPPYSAEAGRDANLYAAEDLSVAHDVRQWCLDNGDNPRLRICLCGYEGEHHELEDRGWSVVAWKANGGYASQGDGTNGNAKRERLWFSPHCLRVERAPRQTELQLCDDSD